MANYPSQLRERDELNLRLGIKSSLSQLRSVIASLYVIYVANDKQAQVTYSKESINGSLTSIKLEDNLAQQIDTKFPAAEKISSLVNKTPLFTAQLEALQVGIELFFHLAKINFVASGLSERTGSSRFQKKLAFATNMILVDLYLSSHSSEDVSKLLAAWLEDKPFASKLEDGLKMLLNTFTEETQYKIRDNNLDEIVFNQEGVYDTVLNEGEAISKDGNEPVGPFRIYKSYVASGMHPYLIEQKQEFKLNGSVSRADLENYAQLVSTALDITPRKTTIEREVAEQPHKQQQSSNLLLFQFDDATKFVWECIKLFNKNKELKQLLSSDYRANGGSMGNYLRINGCFVAQLGQSDIEGFESIYTDEEGYINNGFDARDIEKFAEAINDVYKDKYQVVIDGNVDEEGTIFKLIKLQPQNVDVASEYAPYLTALRTKPFMLLAGISGTGKSRIAREIAKACWPVGSKERNDQVPANFCMVQVKPNWHDSTELLGYVSRIGGEKYVMGDLLPFIAKAWENPSIPHILCLDEMNLAPVEQYFAEYLSVIESRRVDDKGRITTDPIVKKDKSDWFRVLTAELTNDDNLRAKFLEEGISIPQNLFVVGTVNMDETTFSFSRKVLDRAMTIEMNEVNLRSSLSEKPEGDLGYISNILLSNAAKGTDVYLTNQPLCDEVVKYLEKVNGILEGSPFKIAYRTRNEFMLYAVNRAVIEKDSPLWRSLDEMTSMKILSRIEGDEERCKIVLNKLNDLLKEQFAEHLDESVSIKKVNEMIKKLSVGYTSYWA